MDKEFNVTVFFAVAGIAVLFFVSMFYVETTGQYWDNFNQPKNGMCYCHKGIGTYRSTSANGFATNCLAGISGIETKKIGLTTHNKCIDTCGPQTYWWCSN